MVYPQNGDRIVTIDSVTSLHAVYLRACAVHVVAAADSQLLPHWQTALPGRRVWSAVRGGTRFLGARRQPGTHTVLSKNGKAVPYPMKSVGGVLISFPYLINFP